MTTPMPAHGDPRRYRRGCHCDACTRAIARHEKQRIHLKATGAWRDPFTDAAPARAKLLELRDAGYGWRELSAAIGLSDDQLRQVAVGRPSRPAPERIRRDVEAKILRAWVAGRRVGTALVDATGTRRRLRALAVTGWHLGLLAAQTGLSRSELGEIRRGGCGRLRASSAAAVRAFYERVGSRVPGEFGYHSKDVVATANRARRARWVPPLRWGEDIDDPAAGPVVERPVRRPVAVAEDAEFVRRTTGVTNPVLIAGRLGVAPDTLDRYMTRAKALKREPVAA